MPPPLDSKDNFATDVSPSPSEQTVVAPSDTIPTTVDGRYEIERELARGGMGVVYLARDQKLHNKPVVIKVLLDSALRDEWTLRKFQQEQEALARVDHPGVVGILDTGELRDGKPYIVMQFVEGISLRDALTEHRDGLGFDRAAAIVKQIGQALNAVHEKKIFHRDLKPENIMLQPRGRGDEQVKIVDFGVAKVKDSLLLSSTQTGDRSAGTLVYMSPEQLRGEKVSAASDIYSFAATAYEILTGRRPFNPDTAAHLAEMQRAGVQVKPSALRPRLPAKAEELILEGLAFDPSARPGNASEFGDALARALMNEEDTLEFSAVVDQIPSASTLDNSRVVTLTEKEKDVFISYSQADKKTAGTICRRLERAGLNCWIAPRNIPAGKTWAEFITEAIANSGAMVLVLSSKSNESRQVKKEVDIADNKSVPIIPFRIENVPLSKALEYHLAGTQWLDAYTPPLSKHLPQLEETVRSMLGEEAADVQRRNARTVPWRMIAIGVVALIVLAVAAGVWKFKPAAAPRSLTYSLTVQKMVNHQKEGAEFQASGNEREGYGNGWAYRMNITTGQEGYLYILNEGTKNDNVLFPTEPNKNHASANETMQLPQPQANAPAGWYVFDDNPGVERILIIFSAEPLSDLDTIIRTALNNSASSRTKTISDPAQVKVLRDVVARYGNTKPVVEDVNKRSIVSGTGNVLTSIVELSHNPQ